MGNPVTRLLQDDFNNFLVLAHRPSPWVPLLAPYPRAPTLSPSGLAYRGHWVTSSRIVVGPRSTTPSGTSRPCRRLDRHSLVVMDDDTGPSWGTLPKEAIIAKKLNETPWSLPSQYTKWALSPWWVYDLLPRRRLSILLWAGRGPVHLLVGFQSFSRRLLRSRIRFQKRGRLCSRYPLRNHELSRCYEVLHHCDRACYRRQGRAHELSCFCELLCSYWRFCIRRPSWSNDSVVATTFGISQACSSLWPI